jgi:hypothetical protein
MLSTFGEDKCMPQEFVAMTEIQRQVAIETVALDDLSQSGLSISMVNHLMQNLDDIALKFSKSWSPSAEINLQSAKLYVLANCLVSKTRDGSKAQNSDNSTIIYTILERGQTTALRLTAVLREQESNHSVDHTGRSALVTHPKHHIRVAYYVCVFFITYIDYPLPKSTTDIDSARQAVSLIHQMLNRLSETLPELQQASKAIEVFGRAVVPGGGRMTGSVATRMGATIMYNSMATVSKLRGRHYEAEQIAISALPESVPTSAPDPVFDYSNMPISGTLPLSHDAVISVPELEQDFPWGIWNDDAYDALGAGQVWDHHGFPSLAQ